MQVFFTFAVGNSSWDLTSAEVIPYALRLCLIFAFTQAVTVNGTTYTKWTAMRKYLHTFISAAVGTTGDDTAELAAEEPLPLNVVDLKQLINGIVPETEEADDHGAHEPEAADGPDGGSSMLFPESR